MSKEMVISTSPHETKVALVEDGQVVEVYVEREKEFGLVGSIYKGRVTRVLPGMQSAFVNIGLDRDAFLYVSDFFEDAEEYDKIASTVEEKVIRMEENVPLAESTAAPAIVSAPVPEAVELGEAIPEEPAPAAAERVEPPAAAQAPRDSTAHGGEDHPRYSRRRRHRPRHKSFPD